MASFFLDEDVSANLADLLRSYGHTVTDVHDERHEGIPRSTASTLCFGSWPDRGHA